MANVVLPRPTGASFNRHSSNQVVETPRDFLDAVEARFGALTHDLACTLENKKAPVGFIEGDTSPWPYDVVIPGCERSDWLANISPARLWLNPPFGTIAPFAARCAQWWRSLGSFDDDSGRLLMLVPASVGAGWWAESVMHRARVYFLRPRLKFVGHTDPFPRDLALCVYGEAPGFECWRWKR